MYVIYFLRTGIILPILTYNVFTADTLCHAVTLTFKPLTLNLCSRSAVRWSNFAEILAKSSNPRPSYSDLNSEHLAADLLW